MIVKIIGMAFVTAITASILKSTKPELSFAVSIAGVLIILVMILESIEGTITAFSMMTVNTGNITN